MPTGRVTLLYDGACGMCRANAERLRRLDAGRGAIQFEDISSPDFDFARFGVSPSDARARIHAVLGDGRVVSGMQALRHAHRAVRRGRLWALTDWPIVRPVFDSLYAAVARNRGAISRWLGFK
ncbi:MAG: DUF393 domain-containing protein [Phycisphaerae bacterium]